MPKYRKKPVEIEAFIPGVHECPQWIQEAFRSGTVRWKNNFELIISTLEGEMVASKGDYIIRGVQGEIYPCKPDIFETTYEMVGSKKKTDADCMVRYKINDYDFVASHLSLEETNEWYSNEYDDNELEDVEELNIEVDWMWWEVTNEVHQNCIAVDGTNYTFMGGGVFKKVTFKEALEREGEYTKPYIIASTEM